MAAYQVTNNTGSLECHSSENNPSATDDKESKNNKLTKVQINENPQIMGEEHFQLETIETPEGERNPNIKVSIFDYLHKSNTIVDNRNEGSLEENINIPEVTGQQPVQDCETKKTRPKILMGRSALLRKRNKEVDDSLLVRDLVVNKYQDVMNHYIGRSFQRRNSKESLRTYDDDSIDGSPRSLSSVGTPDSYSSQDDIDPFQFPDGAHVQERFKFLMPATDQSKNRLQKSEAFLVTADDVSTTSPDTVDIDVDWVSYCEQYASDKDLKEAKVENRLNNKTKSLTSIASQNSTTLMTRINSICGCLKNSFRRKLHSKRLSSSTRSLNRSISSLCSLDLIHEDSEPSRRFVLEKELVRQNSIILQILKALSYCNSMKEFVSSVEHLEAEKILLLASCRKEAIAEEINKLCFEANYEQVADVKCHGTVEISNFIFFSKIDSNSSDKNREFIEHFVVTIGCNEEVFSSEIVELDGDGRLRVENSFKFERLKVDFIISVCVYSMISRNSLRSYSHESKYHLEKETKKLRCPSPKSILYMNRDSGKQKLVADVSTLKPSSFNLCGKCDIGSRDLCRKQNKEFKMYNVPLDSTLRAEFKADVNSEVKFIQSRSGFLNIGKDVDSGGWWNRRWCVLQNSVFKYWNYPSEETSSPICNISLTDCATRVIDVADRTECVRSKTLMLPVLCTDGTVKKYFLSADSLDEMKEWQNDLNYVLTNLQLWNYVKL